MPNKKSHLHKKSRKPLHKHVRLYLLSLLIIPLTVFMMSPLADFNPKWQEPRTLTSRDGMLATNLIANAKAVLVNGKPQDLPHYNSSYIGSTWEIKGGDTVKVNMANQLNTPTNLHFHGSHVSPKGNSDNVLLSINPNETFEYEYKLPATHPPGLYWYHPHYHPDVETQVLGGMVGAIKVRGAIDEVEGIKGVPERLLVLTTIDGKRTNVPLRLVNGQQKPDMYLRPGQTVRMQVVNASADDIYNLAIPGYTLNIFSRDGNTTSRIDKVKSEVMMPGDRIEFLFTPGSYGTLAVKSLAYDQGFAHYVEDTFMNIRVQGFPTLPIALPKQLPHYDDLRNATINKTRTLTFSMKEEESGDTEFLLDGREVNMNRVDQVMVLGATEEWKLVNETKEVHPFHIHINPFQVISINGQPVERYGYDDTFQVPAKSEVVIRTRYLDFDGKFVLHCHILFHEDHGMMQVVEIVKLGEGPKVGNGLPERELNHATH